MSIVRPGRTPIYFVLGSFFATSMVLVTQPVASAAGISDPPAAPHSIISFPVRDFVSASGYASSDRPTVEVVRSGIVVGTASNLVPQDDPGTAGFDGIVEVNHPGGGCWQGFTPDIRPNDVIRILTSPGTGDSTPTANVTVTQPATKTSNDTVVVKGTAVTSAGTRIPIDQLEARLIANRQAFVVNDRRALRASSVGGDGTLAYDPGKTTWTATFTGLGGVSPVDGLSDADRAVGSQSRVLWLGRDPGAGTEATIFEYGEVGGPVDPCTAPLASGPSVPDMTDATDTGISNTDNITKNSQPTFRGVAGLSTATSVNLFVDGVVRGTTSVAADGTWSVSPDTAISDGPHQVTASENAPGVPETMSPQSLAITVDTSAPAAPTVTGTVPSSPNPNSAPSVRGTAEAGSAVTIHTGSTCVAPGAGSGTAAKFASTGIGVGVDSGSTTEFFAAATDAAGNTSACSTTSAVYTQDSVAPPAPDIDPASTHGLVASTSATFTFSDTEAGVSFRCSRDGGAFVACTSPKSYAALAQGAHTFSVRALDRAGNLGGSATTTWTVDTVRPVVTVQSGPAALGNDASPVFTFSTSEPADTSCSLVLITAPESFAPCTSPQAFTDLPDGRYRFAVKGTDPAGNTSSVVTRTFKVDTRAPSVRLTGTPSAVTNDNTPTFTFSTEAGATTHCSLQASGTPADFAACTSPATFGPLDDGTYTFAVTGTDAAGNTSAPVQYTFRVDTLAPTATPKSPAAGATVVSQTGNVTVQLSEPVNGVTGTSFTLTTPGGPSVPATVTYSATTRVATLNPTANLDPDTEYTVTLSSAITDKAGNALGTTSWTFVTGPRPTAAISPVPNSTTVLVTANVTARFSEAVTGVSADSFTLTGPGGATVDAVFSYNPVTRTATLDPIDPLAAATTYTATVTSAVKDLAGNPFATRTWSFTTRP